MGGTMFSKSLIQFSVDEWGCVPSLWCTWGQTMVEVTKIMGLPDSSDGKASACSLGDLGSIPGLERSQRSYACTATLSAPNPAAGHHWPMSPLETPGLLWASLNQSLLGSLLLSPGSWYAQGSVCAHQKSVSQFCISSGGSMVGLMVTSSKRAYAILWLHPEALPLQQSTADPYFHRRHSDTVLFQSLWVSGSWGAQGLLEPSDVTGDGSKVWCCKEQYCIRTWNVRFMNQGKLEWSNRRW